MLQQNAFQLVNVSALVADISSHSSLGAYALSTSPVHHKLPTGLNAKPTDNVCHHLDHNKRYHSHRVPGRLPGQIVKQNSMEADKAQPNIQCISICITKC